MNSHESLLDKYTKSGAPVKDLSRFTALCAELNINPAVQGKKIKFIHIAGTNGKGSVSEYISTALIEQGFTAGKFTSPFIVNINERIQINNEPVSGRDLYLYTEIAEKAAFLCEQEHGISGFSQFEILTAAMLLYFGDKKTDYAVIETGIGGLLDCTNIITPVISVITAIDYDHSEILGHSLAEIAAHKAGIIKKTVPCILYPEQRAEVFDIVKAAAEKACSELYIPDIGELVEEKISVFKNQFIYKGECYSTAMGGRHQVFNAVTAIEALKLLSIDSRCIKTALAKSYVPARMQVVSKKPAVIIDGAHNPHGLKACRVLLEGIKNKKTLLIGMMNNKDCCAALKEILSANSGEVVFCDGFSDNAADCMKLKEIAISLSFPSEKIRVISNCNEAFAYAENLARKEEGLLLVTGSLYLAGFLLRDRGLI